MARVGEGTRAGLSSDRVQPPASTAAGWPLGCGGLWEWVVVFGELCDEPVHLGSDLDHPHLDLFASSRADHMSPLTSASG